MANWYHNIGLFINIQFLLWLKQHNKEAREVRRGGFDLPSCMRNSYRALVLPTDIAPSQDLCSVQSGFLYVQKTDMLLRKDSGRANAVLVIVHCQHLWKFLFLWMLSLSVRLLQKMRIDYLGSLVHYCDTSECGWCLFVCLKQDSCFWWVYFCSKWKRLS